MNLVQRVKDILLKPQATWQEIDREAATPASLYSSYLVILAAIPAIAGFVGLSIIGVGGLGMTFRVPFFSGLLNMVVGYVLTLVAVYVLSLIVDALAPSFQGRKDPVSALKLVVFGATASLVGGVFNLIPALSVLGLLAALYTIYLIYLGLPVLMKCPPEKALAYTAVVVVCGIVMGVVIGALAALTTSGAGVGRLAGGASGGADIQISTPSGEVKVDTAKLDEMARKMEEAGKRMEQAQASGDTAAVGKAMGDVLGALGGAGGAALPAASLKALLPEAVGELKRESIESSGGQAVGLAGATAKAVYRQGPKSLELSITDLGGLAGAAALAGLANVTADRETPDTIEKTYKQGGRTVKEDARKDGSQGELTVLLTNGVMVEARGRQLAMPQLKAAVDGLDLAGLEKMQRPGKS